MIKDVSKEEIYTLLDDIPDPEIPVISVVELGVIRGVEILQDEIIVSITPTYSGCPAMNVFEQDIESKLKENGFENVTLKTILSPAWTTDWMSDKSLKKLEDYGIAPPVKGSQDKGLLFQSGPKSVSCPKCKSTNTKVISQFGSTACKSLYSCSDCLEPFEYFKCI